MIISVHPNLVAVYRKKVGQLGSLLEDAEHKDEAMELIRPLIEKIELSPREEGGGLDAVLQGDLARILALCSTAEEAMPRGTARVQAPDTTKPLKLSLLGACHCRWLRRSETTEISLVVNF
jgi:hypothetical protein